MNKLTVNTKPEDEIQRIVYQAVSDNPDKFCSCEDGVLYVAPDGIQEMEGGSLENAILEAIAANSVFSVEALRYAYEGSIDDLLKAVAMAQELGSDNLVRCMRSVLFYKHGGMAGGEAIREY